MRHKMHYAWIILVAVFTMMGFTRGGVNGAAGLFLNPVSQDLGIGMGQLTLYFSISSIVTILFLPIAGKLMQKYDIRLILVIAVLLQAGSFTDSVLCVLYGAGIFSLFPSPLAAPLSVPWPVPSL